MNRTPIPGVHCLSTMEYMPHVGRLYDLISTKGTRVQEQELLAGLPDYDDEDDDARSEREHLERRIGEDFDTGCHGELTRVFVTEDGHEFQLREVGGKEYLVVMRGTHCAPCGVHSDGLALLGNLDDPAGRQCVAYCLPPSLVRDSYMSYEYRVLADQLRGIEHGQGVADVLL